MSQIAQYVSLIGLIAALVISLGQSRAATRQSTAATAALQQSSSHELVRYSADFPYMALRDDPDLLAWFLETRGFPAGDAVTNKRYHFLFVRLDIHSGIHDAYRDGLLSEAAWNDWLRSMRLDLVTPEGRLVWRTTADLYSPAFRAQVEKVLPDPPADPRSEPEKAA